MKKNKMMRLASVLLVLVLMTSSVVGGTFAKYTTTVTASDTARVAAWGFGDSTTIDFDLFDDVYGTTVDSADDVNVIAPGTSKEETVTFKYAGTAGKSAPEVDYTIDLNVKKAEIADSIKNNPAITWGFNSATYGTWDDMIKAIEAYHEDVEANQLPTLEKTGIEIKWQWDYAKDGNDTTDTAMGNANPLASVTLEIEMVATQVD